MIPILYETGTKDFMTNGIGPLSDVITCVVTNKLNAEYEIKMTYPITGLHFQDIKNDRIILAKVGDETDGELSRAGKAYQPFFIYKITKPIKGIVTVYGRHISYLSSYIIAEQFRNDETVQKEGEQSYLKGIRGLIGAFNDALIGNDNGNPFVISYSNDLEANNEDVYYNTVPKSVRQVIGDGDDSIISKLEYEVEWDKFNIIFHKKLGSDNNVKIAYGKNLKEFEHTESLETLVTGIYPYCSSTSENESGEIETSVTSLKHPVYAYGKEGYIHYKHKKIEYDDEQWGNAGTFLTYINSGRTVFRKTTGEFYLLEQTNAPSDWGQILPSTGYKNYYTYDSDLNKYEHVSEDATWESGVYYSDGFELVGQEPEDWADNYQNYYYYGDNYTVIPEFESGVYYKRNGKIYDILMGDTPSDWNASSINNEFYIYEAEDGYVRNKKSTSDPEIIPAFEKNKYYSVDKQTVPGYRFYSMISNEPSNWSATYQNYYTYDYNADSRYDKDYHMRRTTSVDLSNYIGDNPELALLVYYAREYLNKEKAFKPETVIKVNFINLGKTIEYENFRNLEKVGLGDTVTIIYSDYNIDAKARVVKTDYNCLTEVYDDIELGDVTTNIVSGIVQATRKESSKAIKESEAKITDQYTRKVEESFAYLTGAGAGYLILEKNNGYRRLDYKDTPPEFESNKYYAVQIISGERKYELVENKPANWDGPDNTDPESLSYGNYKDYYEKTEGNGYDGIIVSNAPTRQETTSCVFINHRGTGYWTGPAGAFSLDAKGLNVSITHQGITANSITTGTLDASEVTIDNLDVNSLFCGKTDENRRPINDYLTIQNGSIVMGSGNTSIKLVQTYNKIQFLDTNQYVQLGHSETSRPDFGKNLYYDRTSTGHYQLLDTEPDNWIYPDSSPSGNWKNYYRQKELAYISGSKFYVNSMDVLSSIYIGNYAMEGAKLSNDENAGLLIGWTGGV